MNYKVPFNKPYVTNNEIKYILDTFKRRQLSGDGFYTKKCHSWIEKKTNCHKALLTHSCTAALEMAAFLIDIKEGDEVIMPSYTFVSTANAFVLRGAIPIFVDIRKDNMKINLLTLNSVEKTEISEKNKKNFSGQITGLKLPKSFGDTEVTLTIAVDVQDKDDYKTFQAGFKNAGGSLRKEKFQIDPKTIDSEIIFELDF